MSIATTYPVPHYMTRPCRATDVVCKRCEHVVGVDYGRRLELRHGEVLVGLITTRYGGRCPNCFLYYEWVPAT